MVIFFSVIFVTSVLTSLFLLSSPLRFNRFLVKSNRFNVQNFHSGDVSRLGGVAVFIGLSIAIFLLNSAQNFLFVLWVASLPVFLTGLYEDVSSNAPPVFRMFSSFVSIFLVFILLDIGVFSLGIEGVDYILSNYKLISLLFTLLVVSGAINAFNVIDGFNGLLGGYSILASIAIAYVAYIYGDILIMQLTLALAVSILGFFIFNFPFGRIFMGDGGAYFIGFVLSIVGLVLASRHKELSNWFILLVFIYPMYELLYSIYRRKFIHKTIAVQPDAEHLHSLIYRKLISCDRFKHNKAICNSATSPLLWLLSLTGIIPAIIWYDNQGALIISAFAFMFIYTAIYKYISSYEFKFNK